MMSTYNKLQTNSGTHTASYPTGNRGSFPGGKAAGDRSEAVHSPTSSAEVKNAMVLYFHPPNVFMAWCLVKAQG